MTLKTAACIDIVLLSFFKLAEAPFIILKLIIEYCMYPIEWTARTISNKLLLASEEVNEKKIKNEDALYYGAYQVYQIYKKEIAD